MWWYTCTHCSDICYFIVYNNIPSRWQSLWKKCTEFICASCSDTALPRSVSTSLSLPLPVCCIHTSTLYSDPLSIMGTLKGPSDCEQFGKWPEASLRTLDYTNQLSFFLPCLDSHPPSSLSISLMCLSPDPPLLLFTKSVSFVRSQGQEREELCHGLCAPDERWWDGSSRRTARPCRLQGQNQKLNFCRKKTDEVSPA